MSKLLNKLVRQNTGKSALLWASAGMLTGYFILLAAIQLYFDMNQLLKNDKDLLAKDFIVINKKVSLLNTLKVFKGGFKADEIELIKKQDFVDEVGIVTPNRFKVGAFTDGNDEFPPFYAEMFFESVPDRFLDIAEDAWKWDSSSAFIPIVIPRDYLKLYNFGFAQSQNLPQISEELAQKALSDFIIEGRGKKIRLKGRIVGFTDRINSILVPENFMQWANKNYGREEDQILPSRLIIVSKNPDDPALFRFLNEHDYEANTQQTKTSRLNALLQILFAAVSLVGIIIIVLALLVFSVSFKLMIARASETIDNLILLGYRYKKIALRYIYLHSIILGSILLLSLLFLWQFKAVLAKQFSLMGFEIESGLDFRLIIFAAGLTILLILYNANALLREFRKRAK